MNRPEPTPLPSTQGSGARVLLNAESQRDGVALDSRQAMHPPPPRSHVPLKREPAGTHLRERAQRIKDVTVRAWFAAKRAR